MSMKVGLAHHFWKDKTNATWNPPQFPYPQIEQSLKEDYPRLARERPRWKQYADITVFFDYRPTRDIYGRDIVPISFAFLSRCNDPESCAAILSSPLSRANTHQLEMDVDLPEGCVRKPGKMAGLLVMAVASICVVGVGIWLLTSGKGDAPQKPVVPAAPEMATPEPTPPTPEQPTQMTPEPAKKPQPVQAAIVPTPKPVLPSPLCEDPGVPAMLNQCEKLYFETFCAGQLAAGEYYSKWRARTKLPKCSRIKESKPLENLPENDVPPQLRRIFYGGK